MTRRSRMWRATDLQAAHACERACFPPNNGGFVRCLRRETNQTYSCVRYMCSACRGAGALCTLAAWPRICAHAFRSNAGRPWRQ